MVGLETFGAWTGTIGGSLIISVLLIVLATEQIGQGDPKLPSTMGLSLGWLAMFTGISIMLHEFGTGSKMVDFAKLRKDILLAAEGISGEDNEDETVSIPETTGWRKELDNLSTTASLSLGAGLLGASIFDSIKNRDGSPMFVEPWKTMVIFSGASLFGFGLGRLTRGKHAPEGSRKLRENVNYD